MKLFELITIEESFRSVIAKYFQLYWLFFSIYPCKGNGSWSCTGEDCPPCLGVDTDGSVSADCRSSWLWAGEVDARDELNQTSQLGKVFRPIYRIARWMWEIRVGGIRLWRSSWGMTPGGLSEPSWQTPTKQERHGVILPERLTWTPFGFPPLPIHVSEGFAERIMPAQKTRSRLWCDPAMKNCCQGWHREFSVNQLGPPLADLKWGLWLRLGWDKDEMTMRWGLDEDVLVDLLLECSKTCRSCSYFLFSLFRLLTQSVQ